MAHNGSKKTVYRNSRPGEFISKATASRKNPATWEKERVPVGKK